MLNNYLKHKIAKKIFKLPYQGFGIYTSERIIEVPWALSLYAGEKRVLEVGYSNAEPEYLNGLLNLKCKELHGVDIVYKEVDGIIKKQADIRKTDFPDNYFDLILCISTIEHVGRNNSIYTENTEPIDMTGDFEAVVEMKRILKKGGKLIITVPFGKFVDYGWFIHYDEQRWNSLKHELGASLLKEDYFIYKQGWFTSNKEELKDVAYQDNGAPHATGLLCALFVK